MKILTAVLVFLSLSAPAQACLWAGGQRQSLFKELPVAAKKQPVSARVRVMSVKQDDITAPRVITLKVIEATRGVHQNESIVITDQTTSCTIDHDVKKGQKYYIAGQRDAGGQFHGVWNGLGEYVPHTAP